MANQTIVANYIGETKVVAKVYPQRPQIVGRVQTGGKWPPPRWGDIAGSIDNQQDLSEKFTEIEQEISGKVINDAVLSLQKNGVEVATFSANQDIDATANFELSKEDVGLESVDNTADADKPVSTAAQTALNAKLDKNFVGEYHSGNLLSDADIALTSDNQGAQATMYYINPDSGATSNVSKPYPIVGEDNVGLSTPSDHTQIATNTAAIAALQSETPLNYLVTFSSTTPTQEEIQTLYEEQSGKTGEALESTTLFDSAKQMYAKWYTAYDSWQIFAASSGGSGPTPIATNTSYGIVKGSTSAGKIYAENDGTLSLNGFDAIETNIENNTAAIQALQDALANYVPRWG